MRRAGLVAAVLAVAVMGGALMAPVAGADEPLKLKRTGVVKHGVKLGGKHIRYRVVLRSPGKGIVGIARVRCSQFNHCSVRTKFSEGKVIARGTVAETRRQTVPIVGGNHTFRHAKGTLIVRPDRNGHILWIYKLESFG